MRKAAWILLILAACAGQYLFAGTTGKMLGKVTDEDGNPVGFARVFLEGTRIGGITKDNGEYIIINIPPGSYNVICQRQGFNPEKRMGVGVNVDENTRQSFVLRKQVAGKIDVRVSTKREEMVKKDNTGSGSKFNGDNLADMAAKDINDIVATKAGVVQGSDGDLHIRGGRSGEVQYTIDGMSVSDPVSGTTALSVDTDAILTMSVSTGGFTAEFGNAQSGVVNIVTRSGGKNYSGKIELNSDVMTKSGARNRDEVKVNFGGPIFPWVRGEDRDKFTFFFNSGGSWSDGRYASMYYSNPNKELKYLTSQYPSYSPDTDPFRNDATIASWNNFGNYFASLIGPSSGIDVPRRNYNSTNSNLKLRYRLSNTQDLTVAYRSDADFNYPIESQSDEPYLHPWRYALQHYRQVQTDRQQVVGTYDHTFGGNMNLKLKGSYYETVTKQSPKGIKKSDFYTYDSSANNGEGETLYLDANTDGVADYNPITRVPYPQADDWKYEIATYTGGSQSVPGFVAPYTISDSFIDDRTTTYSLRGDFEWQYDLIHGFKSGFEAIYYDIEKDRHYNMNTVYDLRKSKWLAQNATPVGWTENQTDPNNPTPLYDSYDEYKATLAAAGDTDGYKAHPWQGAYYIQDKMEWEGMVVNAGMRFDMWYLGGDYDIITPDYTGSFLESIHPDTAEGQGNYQYLPGSGDTSNASWQSAKRYYDRVKDKFEKPRIMVSPRLGVSHPISESDVVHFAYNYQNQIPLMQYIFTTARQEDAITNTGLILGNPELDPQITITYEVGLQHQLSDIQVMDLTAYFKNIYNYVSMKKFYDEEEETISWYQYISNDYGSCRGVDLNLQRMPNNFVSGTTSYSLSWAKGNNSGVSSDDNLREFPLNWDTRNVFNLNLEYRINPQEKAPIESVLDFVVMPFPLLFFTDYSFTNWIDTGYDIPLDDFSVNVLYNWSSGTPYTPVTHEGNALDTNSKNMDATDNCDLSITKGFILPGHKRVKLSATVDNLFNNHQVTYVYPKTGKPNDDDANLEIGNYLYPETEYIYNRYINDPSNYSAGRTYELGISFNW